MTDYVNKSDFSRLETELKNLETEFREHELSLESLASLVGTMSDNFNAMSENVGEIKESLKTLVERKIFYDGVTKTITYLLGGVGLLLTADKIGFMKALHDLFN